MIRVRFEPRFESGGGFEADGGFEAAEAGQWNFARTGDS